MSSIKVIFLFHIDEFGAEGGGPSQSFLDPVQPQPSFSEGLTDQGPAVSPPNYNNIQIPPGSYAPANTPADLPRPSGMFWTSITPLL